MENASKALIMAGAVFIAVMLISLFIYVFSAIGNFNSQTQAQQYSNQVIAANRFFVESAYDINSSVGGVQIMGYDAYNIIRKALDINDDPDAAVTIDIIAPSYTTFDRDSDSILDETERANMKKEYNYSYSMDSEGYVNKIIIE